MTKKQPSKQPKDKPVPNLPRHLFWEMDYDLMNWHRGDAMVIQRVLERGEEEDWKELIRFYSLEKVLHVIKFEIDFFFDHTIEGVCTYFNLKPDEIRSSSRKKIYGSRFP